MTRCNVEQIKDAVGNEYGRPKDIAGEQRTVFTSHADAAFDICFENILTNSRLPGSPSCHPFAACTDLQLRSKIR